MMTMVGDAYAAPLVAELRRGDYDLTSLAAIGTGGAATNLKHQQALLELLPQLTLINGYGSSETGNMGFGHSRGDTRTDTFTLREGGLVLSEDYSHFLAPGEDEVGWAAREGRIPLGYFDDPDATRKTFPEVDGKRVVISGDRAALEADGTLRFFGRDSLVVNTGGEKVFVEEVEEVLRAHPDIADALVVGRASERWGEELVALIQPRDVADVVSTNCCTTTARPNWPASRRPRSSSSSNRSTVWATARPTTAGPKGKRQRKPRCRHDRSPNALSIAWSTCTSVRPKSNPHGCSRFATTTSRAPSRCSPRWICRSCSTRWTSTACVRPS